MPRYKPQKVGILGAGMMGAGIAYAQASRGIATVLKDVTPGQGRGRQGLQRQAHAAARGQGPHEPARPGRPALAHHGRPNRSKDLQGCDLIIEAVFENRELKARVTQEAEPMLAPGGFFASNTSTLPISGLAKASARPEKFVGIHFFSPVDKMKLVEIIRGKQTDDETVARAFDYVQAIGKIPIVVNDSRGFFTSRVFGTFVMEGAAMVGEGIPAAVVEQAGIQAGMPVGPLAVLDETALSLSVHVLDQTRADYARRGRHLHRDARRAAGRAHGQGVRPQWPRGRRRLLRVPGGKRREEIPVARAQDTCSSKPGAAWDMQDLKDRLLYRQAVETARCLAENVLTSVHDANIGSIFGIGFPGWTGGAMQFIYGMGIEAFLQRARRTGGQVRAGLRGVPRGRGAIRKHQPRWLRPAQRVACSM